jgi:demethylmenaquinone methyltransferase/2-methoxy-6-polyprenyl-1,4-benzoquinol methylase
MGPNSSSSPLEAILTEQQAFYRSVAAEYEKHLLTGVGGGGELVAALDDLRPTGDVLELACGPGTWTAQLLRHADTVTAVDGSPEMLKIASALVTDPRVRFVEADLFSWLPDRRYDVVFFGFWISHVPLARFEAFWSSVSDCVEPDGQVLFVDDAHRTAEELVHGKESQLVRRRLIDGSQFTIVKVPHEPEDLQRRIASLGWDVTVTRTSGPFYWGVATPAASQ